MIQFNPENEYVYTSKIFIQQSFFNFYDKTDPEIKVLSLQNSNHQTFLAIISKVFVDKYSARNWIFRILKLAIRNGATAKDLAISGMDFCVCNGHQVDKFTANKYWGKFPPLENFNPFMKGDGDIEFTLAIGGDIYKVEALENEVKYKLDNFLDSSNNFLNQFKKDEFFLKIKGPTEAPYKLDFKLDINELTKNIESLTENALNYKSYTIPSNSVVDLKTTSYRYLEMIEEYNSVVFIFRDYKDYFTLGFDISKGIWYDDYVVLNKHDQTNEEEELFHKLSVKYIASIVLHDFWVTEYKERTKIWNLNRPKPLITKLPWSKFDQDGRTNIYLPRIKYYNNSPDNSTKVNEQEIFAVKNRIFQPISYGRCAHTRDLRLTSFKPNEDQVLLANEYGIKVPEGFTFVRPANLNNELQQKREIQELNKYYLSRSALKTLFNVEVYRKNYQKVSWAQFERDSIKYCTEQLGLIKLDRKIRKGDEGIDILCIQKKKDKIYYWAIQCKCWSKNRTVGINVLRELFAAGLWTKDLSEEQKKNLRYMIITTSDFSTDEQFQKNAKREKVVLINGTSFINKVIPDEFK